MWGKHSLMKSRIDDNKEWNLLGDFTQTGYSFCLSGILHPAVSSFNGAPRHLVFSRHRARWEIERSRKWGVCGGCWRRRHIHNDYAKCSQTPGELSAHMLGTLISSFAFLGVGEERSGTIAGEEAFLVWALAKAKRQANWVDDYFQQEKQKQKQRVDVRMHANFPQCSLSGQLRQKGSCKALYSFAMSFLLS